MIFFFHLKMCSHLFAFILGENGGFSSKKYKPQYFYIGPPISFLKFQLLLAQMNDYIAD